MQRLWGSIGLGKFEEQEQPQWGWGTESWKVNGLRRVSAQRGCPNGHGPGLGSACRASYSEMSEAFLFPGPCYPSASGCVASRLHGAPFRSLHRSPVQYWDPQSHGDCWVEGTVPSAFLGGQATKRMSGVPCDSPFALWEDSALLALSFWVWRRAFPLTPEECSFPGLLWAEACTSQAGPSSLPLLTLP